MRLFPGFVCRVAGLQEGCTQELKLNNSIFSSDQLLHLEDLITKKKNLLSDIIYDLIAKIDRQENRNALLTIRRKIFNLKKIDEDDLNNFFSQEAAALHKELFERVQTRKNILTEIEQNYKTELIKIRSAFKKQIQDEDFQKGLLISSKVLYDSQNVYFNSHPANLNRKQEQIERGLLRYYSRMVMKATPFGTFCSIIPGQINNNGSNGFKSYRFTADPSQKSSLVLINKGLYAAILNHIINRKEIKKKLKLELNQTISINENTFVYLTSINDKEIFQRLESNEVLELFVTELKRLNSITFENLVKLVCSLEELEASEEEAEQYIDKLIEIGFLKFKIGIPEQQVDWVEPLCEILKNIKDEHAEKIHSLLSQLQEGIKSYKDFRVAERAGLLKKMDGLLKSNFEEMEIKTNLKADLPFYEDATSDSTFILSDKLFEELKESLSDFILHTRKVAYPRTEHISMRHFFDIHYKENNDEIPLLKFYEDYYKEHFKEHLEKQQKIQAGNKDEELKKYNVSNPFDLEIIKKIQTAQSNLRNLITQKWIDNLDAEEININKDEIAQTLSGVPDSYDDAASASIFAQIVIPAGKEKSRWIIPGGKYLLGYGKYFSRFLRLLSDDIQEKLIDENNSLSADIIAEISGDANFNANLHPPLVKYEISYPTSEVGLAEVQLNCNDLIVIKNPNDNNSLQIKHKPDGKIVQLSKFTAPSNFSIQIPEKPEMNKIKNKENENEAAGRQESNLVKEEKPDKDNDKEKDKEKIVYRPRILYDDVIVLSRKSWIIPFSLFPSINNNENDVDYFIRVNKWRIENNIPEEIYIKIHPLPLPQQPPKTEKTENKTEEKKDEAGETKTEAVEKKDEQKDPEVKSEAVEKNDAELKTQTQENVQKKTTKMSRDFYKPQYIDFLNPLLVNLFGKLTVNLKNFSVTIEEKYPDKSQMPEYEGKYFSTEQIFQMNFSNVNNPTVSENKEEFTNEEGIRL